MKILKVYGYDDYAALAFNEFFDAQNVKDIILNRQENEIELNAGDHVVCAQLIELNTPEEVFEYCKRQMLDYEDSKHRNFYEVK